MADFGSILRKGKRRFEIKNKTPIPSWGRCEACEVRTKVFPYNDEKKEIWLLCGECADMFIKDEE